MRWPFEDRTNATFHMDWLISRQSLISPLEAFRWSVISIDNLDALAVHHIQKAHRGPARRTVSLLQLGNSAADQIKKNSQKHPGFLADGLGVLFTHKVF